MIFLIFILNITEKDDFDIVVFMTKRISNYSDRIENMSHVYNYNKHPNSIVVHKGELSILMVNINGYYLSHNVTIWAEYIKSKV